MVHFIALTLGVLASVVLNLISADSLQFLYTVITPGTPFPEFTANGLVNEQQASYYDSNKKTMIPRMDCVNNIRNKDPDFWNKETGRVQQVHEDLKLMLNDTMKIHNHTKGIHTMQLLYSCEWNNRSILRETDHHGYDGVGSTIHDLGTLILTAANDKAVITKNQWDADYSRVHMDLENICTSWLKYVSNCRETLEKKVPPEALMFRKFSSSPELVCHATGFFPKGLNITWQKDRENLIEDVELRETLPNQDGSFQKRSILKVSPEDLQKHEYTCVIKHSGLKEDLVLKARERRILRDRQSGEGSGGGSDGVPIGIIVGAVGAVLALVLIVAGILVWKKKKPGFRSVPQNQPESPQENRHSNGHEEMGLRELRA